MSPLATKSATAWTTLPKLVAVPRGVSARTSCSRNHLSGQPRMPSSPLPDSETGSVRVAHRPVADGGVAQAPPAGRVGQRHQRLAVAVALGRQHGEPLDRAAGAPPTRRDPSRPAQLGHQPVERDVVAGTAGYRAHARRGRAPTRTSSRNRLGRSPPSSRSSIGGDVQLAAGPRAGHVEQATLLLQQVGRSGAGADAGARELLGTQGRAAGAQVGPDALLGTDDPDLVPLQALGAVRGEDAHGIGPGAPIGDRLAPGSAGRRGSR